jgi:hypothetical protein
LASCFRTSSTTLLRRSLRVAHLYVEQQPICVERFRLLRVRGIRVEAERLERA